MNVKYWFTSESVYYPSIKSFNKVSKFNIIMCYHIFIWPFKTSIMSLTGRYC